MFWPRSRRAGCWRSRIFDQIFRWRRTLDVERNPMKSWLGALMLGLGLIADAPALTFKLATLAPDGTQWMKSMRAGAEEVAQRTEGRVELRFYPGGVMGNDQSVIRKIRAGQLQGGALSASGLGSIYPDFQAYSMPLLFDDYREVDLVRPQIDPLISAGLQQAGFANFGIGEGGFAYLMSNKPIHSPEEMSGQKVWIPEGDRVAQAALDAVNIAPIPLPMTDVLTGLQTGLLDTVANTPAGTIALQWHTRVRYLSHMPLVYSYGALVIQESALSRLEPKDRQVLQQVLERSFQDINAKIRADDAAAMEALKAQGIELIAASKEGLKQWRRQVEAAIDRLVAQGFMSAGMVAKVRQAVAAARKPDS